MCPIRIKQTFNSLLWLIPRRQTKDVAEKRLGLPLLRQFNIGFLNKATKQRNLEE